ncbi:MAG: Hsp20/alpha crystallin family protein [Candidatus Thiodiazotropha lotti]|nr:Hsp20/alpha crystallin family protein [Candidatus Thiodiazotropha endoloripes]MCG7984925.1 Hsp20/alpha crystallin family protein [Candidatus Thiodiazotropha lotti]MCW4182269.1 Hsp20/alpha crystallin family protein [Candidatus Thiodiazotropha weberae]MCG7990615.1 Hsp20/alpha crystallin family protein [Candidatus Thiodiazotropha lotti]MCG8001671.1 Hsp20/alpha crystallin family protein [Candidatus Thiodiazotropha lotti]MCW4193445.1 Hsp20/alpha crystallin family protein [Candidatus Thiodiazotro
MFARLNGFDRSLTDNFMHLESEMERLFEVAGLRGLHHAAKHSVQPQMHIGSTPEQVDIYLPVAGIDPKAVNISLERNQMTISGQRDVEKSDSAKLVKKERFDGEFRYQINLPDDVDQEKVEASYEQGVLHVKIARREAAKPRQITIQ